MRADLRPVREGLVERISDLFESFPIITDIRLYLCLSPCEYIVVPDTVIIVYRTGKEIFPKITEMIFNLKIISVGLY